MDEVAKDMKGMTPREPPLQNDVNFPPHEQKLKYKCSVQLPMPSLAIAHFIFDSLLVYFPIRLSNILFILLWKIDLFESNFFNLFCYGTYLYVVR